MNTNRLIALAVLILPIVFASQSTYAARAEITGNIEYTIKHDEGVYPEYPFMGIGLVNVTGQGSCPEYLGVTNFAVHDRDQYSMVLSANIAGRPVEVLWDDTIKNASGQCKVLRIMIQR